jgi:hypothetical protein
VCAPLQTIFFHCKPVVHGSTNLYNKLTNLSNNLQQSQRRLLLHQSTVGWWLTFPPSPRPGRTACAPCHEAVELDGAPGLSVSVSVCACTRSPVPMQGIFVAACTPRCRTGSCTPVCHIVQQKILRCPRGCVVPLRL